MFQVTPRHHPRQQKGNTPVIKYSGLGRRRPAALNDTQETSYA